MTILQTLGRFAGRSFQKSTPLSDYFALRRQRNALRNLTRTELDDIGISEQDALREANRSLWDMPQHWQN